MKAVNRSPVDGFSVSCGLRGMWGMTMSQVRIKDSYLAFVAVNVEASIQSHNSDGFVLANLRHDGIMTNTAARSKFPVEESHE